MARQERTPGTSAADAKPDSPKPARKTPMPGTTRGTAEVEARPDKPVKAKTQP